MPCWNSALHTPSSSSPAYARNHSTVAVRRSRRRTLCARSAAAATLWPCASQVNSAAATCGRQRARCAAVGACRYRMPKLSANARVASGSAAANAGSNWVTSSEVAAGSSITSKPGTCAARACQLGASRWVSATALSSSYQAFLRTQLVKRTCTEHLRKYASAGWYSVRTDEVGRSGSPNTPTGVIAPRACNSCSSGSSRRRCTSHGWQGYRSAWPLSCCKVARTSRPCTRSRRGSMRNQYNANAARASGAQARTCASATPSRLLGVGCSAWPHSKACSASINASPVGVAACAWRSNAAVIATLLSLCANSSGLTACVLPSACSRLRANACPSRLCQGCPAALRNGVDTNRQRPSRSAWAMRTHSTPASPNAIRSQRSSALRAPGRSGPV